MPDRRETLIEISTVLHAQLEALRALNVDRDRGLSLAMHRLGDAIDHVERLAGFEQFEHLVPA